MNDYILFDLDGTLTDPKVGITTSVQYALKAFGIDEPDIEKLTPFIGPPLKDSFMEYYGFDEAQAQAAIEKYRERFKDTGIFENELYPGVPEMLKKLKGNRKKLAVASSKPRVFVERILEHFDIGRYFDVVVGSELDGTRTDKAEVVQEALRRLYGEDAGPDELADAKKNTVMVGDRKFDVAGAKAEGIVSVAVTYGYGPLDELRIAKPDYTVRSVAELEKLLLRGSEPEEKRKKGSPAAALWDICFPALMFWFVREIGANIGYLLVAYFAGILPEETAARLLIVDEAQQVAYLTAASSSFIQFCGFALAGFVTWYFFARKHLCEERKQLALKHARLRSPAAYAAVILCTVAFTAGLNALYQLTGISGLSESYRQTAEAQYMTAVPVGLFLYGIVTPLAEELLFRGVIFNRMNACMKTGTAIVLSAFLFGLYHQNIVQGSYAFLMGLLIAWCYERFGRFLIPLLLHALHNLTSYLLTVAGRGTGFALNWGLCVLLLAAGAGALVFLFMQGRVNMGGMPEKQEKNKTI